MVLDVTTLFSGGFSYVHREPVTEFFRHTSRAYLRAAEYEMYTWEHQLLKNSEVPRQCFFVNWGVPFCECLDSHFILVLACTSSGQGSMPHTWASNCKQKWSSSNANRVINSVYLSRGSKSPSLSLFSSSASSPQSCHSPGLQRMNFFKVDQCVQ